MNPIPYNNLFDIDGLKMAIKEAEVESDNFGKSATEDFKRINSVVKSLRKELEALGVTMSKPIKLTDDAAQEQVRNLSKQVSELTQQFNTQKAALSSLKGVMDANKQAIADARLKSAEYEAQLKKERVATQEARTATAQLTLDMRRQAQANREGTQAQTAATGSYKEAQQRLTALGNAIRNTENGFKSTTPELRAQIKEYNTLNDALKKFDAQMGNHQRNVGNYKGAIGGLFNSLKSLALGYVSIQAAIALAMSSFDVALKMDAVRTSLAFTLKSTEAANDKLKELKETANRLGLDFTPLANSYAMFAGAARAANFPLDQTNKIFNSISGAAARFHLTSDQLTGSLLAIQQMISKGTVQSEELRGQLGERLPGAFSIAARAMGVTEKQLGKLLESGQVLASDLLPKLATELDKTFSLDGNTKIDSLTASTNRLKTAFDTALQGDGIGKFFKQIVEGATNALVEIDKLIKSRSFTELTSRIFNFNGGATYDKINAIQDNYQTGAAIRKDFSYTGTGSNTVASLMTGKPLAELEKLRQQYLKATVQAEQAVNVYRKGIADGSLSDGGKLALKDVEKNFASMQSILTGINTAYAIVDKRTPKVSADLKALSDDQLTSIDAIRKRITELSKLPESAIDGSGVNNRIDALKARLKALNGSLKETKQGFALYEAQLNKVALLLQEQIILDAKLNDGKPSKRTIELANAYTELTHKIVGFKDAQKDALEAAENLYAFNNRGKNENIEPGKADTSALAGGLGREFILSDLKVDANKVSDELDRLVSTYTIANTKILTDYKNRKITKAELDAQQFDLDRKQAEKEYNLRSRLLKDQLKIESITNGENTKDYQRLHDKKTALDNQRIKDIIQFAEKEKQIITATYDEIFEYIEKSAQVIGNTVNQGTGKFFSDLTKGIKEATIANKLGESLSFQEKFQLGANLAIDGVDAYTQFAIDASNRRIDQLNKEREHDLTLAGDNKEAKLAIEAEYNKKIAEEKTKQAKNARAAAAIEIVINTAVGISKVIAQGGIISPFLIPAIAALGAIELGLVLSQPLPQYAVGRKDGKAEFAEVNERGPELIGQRGKYRIANAGKRGVAYLNRGDEVITATDTKMLMANDMLRRDGELSVSASQSKAIYDTYIMTASRANNIDYDKMAGAVAEGVSGLPVSEQHWDDRGYHESVRIRNTRIVDINRRNRF